jgi:hypothetical protein
VTVLTFTGPVAVPEQYAFDLGRLHIGYAVANFGAVLLSSQETISTDQSYLTDGWAGAQWFTSSGGVAALGAVIGEATDTAAPQTVTLTGGAAAGDYLLIGCAVATAPFGPWPVVAADIAITDSQGAGTIDTSGFDQWAFGGNAPDANGWNIVIAWGFNAYHLAAPLGAGDTVTIAFPNTPTAYITTRIHVLQHVRSPVPLGQDPPGPFVGWSFLAQFLPKTSNFVPIHQVDRHRAADGPRDPGQQQRARARLARLVRPQHRPRRCRAPAERRAYTGRPPDSDADRRYRARSRLPRRGRHHERGRLAAQHRLVLERSDRDNRRGRWSRLSDFELNYSDTAAALSPRFAARARRQESARRRA